MCQNVLQSVVIDSAIVHTYMLLINLPIMDRQSFLEQMFYVYMYDSATFFVYQFTSYQQSDNKSLHYR